MVPPDAPAATDGAPAILEAEVLDHVEVAPEHYVLTLDAPEIAGRALPGQFVMVRDPDRADPLLPRAYSVYHADPEAGCFDLLYREVGHGTRCLRRYEPGMSLLVWGPLGNTFSPPGDARVLLVGGGVGVPPLVYFAETLARREAGRELVALIGAATRAYVVGVDHLTRARALVRVATDNGTLGHHGRVTDLIPAFLDGTPTRIYACGPMPMLAAVARVAEEHGVPAELALEAPMACGVGACLGCTVPRRSGGYARVCTDGPVFPATEIAW